MKLTMDVQDWIARSEALPFFQFVPVNARIAVESVVLPEFPHEDPADRMIVATARSMNATLITKDEKIRKYIHVKTLW